MNRNKWFLGGIGIIFFIMLLVYFFFPTSQTPSAKNQEELKVNFLDVDPHFADSVLKTLSIEEKIDMLLIYQPGSLHHDSITHLLNGKIPGGYLFSSHQVHKLKDTLNRSRSLTLMDYRQFQIPIFPKHGKLPIDKNNIFPSDEIFFSIQSDTLLKESIQALLSLTDYLKTDAVILPQININSKTKENNKKKNNLFWERIKILNQEFVPNNILPIQGNINKLFDLNKDKVNTEEKWNKPWQLSTELGTSIFILDSSFHSFLKKENELEKYLKKEIKFNGIIFAALPNKINKETIQLLWKIGVNSFITHKISQTHLLLADLLLKGIIKENEINARVKKILLAKTWCKMRFGKVTYEVKNNFNSLERSLSRRTRKAGIILLSNDDRNIPISNIIENKIAVINFGKFSKSNFTGELYRYLPKKQIIPFKNYLKDTEWNNFNPNDFTRYQTIIINCNIQLNDKLKEKIILLAQSKKVIFVNYLHRKNLSLLQSLKTVIHAWDDSFIEQDFSAQAIMGGLPFNAKLFEPVKIDKKEYCGIVLKQSRLQYAIPEDVGIHSDSLLKIFYIVNEGIRNKAFPAAQVFFALNGIAFYNQAFGTPVYNEHKEVLTDDLFDMASVTKVAATTIIAMSLYEKNKYKLDDSLYRHIPDTLKKHIHQKSSLRNITFRQLLIHASGLAAGQPILKYIRYRDSSIYKIGRFDKYYCDYSDDNYSIKVAEEFFMEKEQADTIWYAMNRMSVDERPSYRYSDANMNLLFKLFNPLIKNRWQYYLDSLFYKPLGMFNTFYTPLDFEIEPERIIPTENDKYWRKQLLRGYVHDPTAALFGGVAGNAGLFSTAEDIGILFQMLLQGGTYGGKQFFKKETVDLFISQQSGSHRGLGFNRQVKNNTYGVSPFASNNTFGHTGFTGISVWVDPDIQLVYVSCTNRVHPSAENKKIIQLGTTKRIHNVIYEQLKYIMPDKIELN